MKREILCPDCKTKMQKLFPTSNPYPGEYIKFVDGRAKKDFLCDGCVNIRPIKEGDICTAFSIWSENGGIPYFPWESDFIYCPEKNGG
jgi:hypothetical protein